MSERKFLTMAKKTARPDASDSSIPSRRRAPANGRRAANRRAPVGDGPIPSAPTPADVAPDNGTVMRSAGDMDGAAGRTPSAEEIAEAAYRRYLERGGQHGRDFDDWLEAERSLRSR